MQSGKHTLKKQNFYCKYQKSILCVCGCGCAYLCFLLTANIGSQMSLRDASSYVAHGCKNASVLCLFSIRCIYLFTSFYVVDVKIQCVWQRNSRSLSVAFISGGFFFVVLVNCFC